MSNSAYSSLTSAEDVLKKVAWDNALKVGLSVLYAKAPYLAVWPLKPIIEALAAYAWSSMFEYGRELVDVTAITMTNAAHKATFEKVQVTLAIIKAGKGADSAEFKAAREQAALAFGSFWAVGQ